MKIFEIYFRDLVPEAQEAALSFFGVSSPQDANRDSFPISAIEVYDEHSDVEAIGSLGDDTRNGCADCAYSSESHFADGACVRRAEESDRIDKRIRFDERYDIPEFNTTTLYFIAPVELLKGKYPEAESMEIRIEFPADKPEADYADVMFSPTKDGLDYDWFYGEMSYGEIEALIGLAMSANEE